jgi:hypothetical protein
LVQEVSRLGRSKVDRYLHWDDYHKFYRINRKLCDSEEILKKQSMQWTKKGTHLLLQARTKVLNNDWEGEFRKKYPKFRAIKSLNKSDEIK